MNLLIASLLSRAGTGGTGGTGPVSMVPVGEWALDETGGVTFADSRPAAVSMTIVGTWNSLTTASMAVGLAGTSAYRGTGAAYATLPADNPAHALAEMTLSLYYQRNSATANHMLLSIGSGTVPGDLELLVRTDGKLSLWHIDQNGVLRYAEGSAGITGTNLGVNIAHRIDVSFGQLGVKLHLNGAFLSAAWITDDTKAWNNARVKYIGIAYDGVSLGADGGFDEIRLWGGQLSDAQISTLQPAQSVVLTVAPAPVAVNFNAGDLIQGTGVKLIDVLGVAGTVYTGIPTITIDSQNPSNLGATVDTSAWGAYGVGERPRLSIPTGTAALEAVNGSATAVAMTVDATPKQTMVNWGFGMGVPSEWGGGQTNWQNVALPIYQQNAAQLYTNLGTKILRLNTFARDWAPVIVDAVNVRGVDHVHVTNYGWQASGASIAARATALVTALEAALVNPGGIPFITSVSPQNEPGAQEAFSDDVSDVVTAIRTELTNRGHGSVMVYPPEYANADSACLTGHQDIINAGAPAINAIDAGASHSYNMAPGPDLFDDKLDQVGVKKTVWQFEMGNGDWNSVASRVLSDLNAGGVASEVWHHGQAPNDGVDPATLGGSQRLVNFDGTSNPYYTAFRLAAQAFPRGCVMRTVTNSYDWPSLTVGQTRPISARAASRGWYTFGTKPAVCYAAGKRADGTWRLAVMNATYGTDLFSSDFAGHFHAQTIQVTITFNELTGVNGTWTGFRGIADGSTTTISYPLVNGQLRLTLASQDMVVLGDP